MTDRYHYKSLGKKVHTEHFPHTFRALIVGQSGAGKAALLMKMLLQEGLLNYDKSFVFAKSLYQPEYKILKSGLENNLSKKDIIAMLRNSEYKEKNNFEFDEIAEALKEISHEQSDIECEFHGTPELIPDPSELDINNENIKIFDDNMTDKKTNTS